MLVNEDVVELTVDVVELNVVLEDVNVVEKTDVES